MRTELRPASSSEKIDGGFTSTAGGLDATTPEVAAVVAGEAETWWPASWLGTPDTTGTAQTDAVHVLPVGVYTIRVRVDAGVEQPVRDSHILKVHP